MEHLRNAKSAVADAFTEGRGDYPPPGKAGQMQCGFDGGSEEQVAPYIHTLKNDLANTYLWSNNCFKDYWFFVANWHPLLGIFLSHPYHPWGKRERLQMLLISLFLTMPMSVYISKQARINQLSPGATTGLTVMFVTIPDTVIGVLLYQLSIADTRCPACAPFWDFVNRMCMNCFLVVGLLSAGICYLMLQGAEVHWLRSFQPLFMGKFYSYATWFPIWFLLPCMGFMHEWYMEKKALDKEAGSPENSQEPLFGNNNNNA